MGFFRVLTVLLVLAAAAHAEDFSLEGDVHDYLAEQPQLPEQPKLGEPLLASSASASGTDAAPCC